MLPRNLRAPCNTPLGRVHDDPFRYVYDLSLRMRTPVRTLPIRMWY